MNEGPNRTGLGVTDNRERIGMSDLDRTNDELVFAGSDGEPFTTSLVIASETGNEHASVMRLIRNNVDDFNDFGLVRFEIRPRLAGQHGGGDVEYAILNEPQATLLISFSRNTDVIKSLKKRLVAGFYAMRKMLAERATEVQTLTPLEYARKLVDAEERAEAGAKFQRAIEAGDGLTPTAFHKKYFSAVREIDFFTHLYSRKWLINQRGKGSVRISGPRSGTRRDGSEHRHPTFKGKPYMYLHGAKDHSNNRRENTRIRPGSYELQLRDRLVAEGLSANENTVGLFELEPTR